MTPMLLPGISQAILVGDECQLPSMVRSNVCSHYQAYINCFLREFIITILNPPVLLIHICAYSFFVLRFVMKLVLGEAYLKD